ncbi:MAG: hypothetical protein NW200_09565, partial [Hyphomonadaceae bacterium]|nr:hypothetical protein [Hyphomonadaceae bacterium]
MIVVKVAPTGGAPLVMEMMMKRLFAAAVAVAALAAAAPANADPHRYDGARAHQGDRYDHRG